MTKVGTAQRAGFQEAGMRRHGWIAALVVLNMGGWAWGQEKAPAAPAAPSEAKQPDKPADVKPDAKPDAKPDDKPTARPVGTVPLTPPGKSLVKIGDPAPELKVMTWVKGEPVKGYEKGKIYVVELWATWCLPCKECIPHLTELQRAYKDRGVRVVGVSIWENT